MSLAKGDSNSHLVRKFSAGRPRVIFDRSLQSAPKNKLEAIEEGKREREREREREKEIRKKQVAHRGGESGREKETAMEGNSDRTRTAERERAGSGKKEEKIDIKKLTITTIQTTIITMINKPGRAIRCV